MRIIATLLLVFAFFACSDEKETKPNIEIKEEVLIEQSDEKTEVNDSNIPLPVGDTSKLHNTSSQTFAFNGGGGGRKCMSFS